MYAEELGELFSYKYFLLPLVTPASLLFELHESKT
jgi:hypothetical protein